MKKQSLIILIGIVCSIFFFPFFTTTYGAPDKPIELKASSSNPGILPISKVTEAWAKKVEELSGGTVKLTFYWGGTLAQHRDSYQVIQTGVADIGMYLIGRQHGLHTLNEFTGLPMMGWKDIYSATKIYHEMRKKFPQLDAEFKGVKTLYLTFMPADQLHFTKKTVRTMEDMRGLRILCGQKITEFVSALGATPIDKPGGDWYMSLQTGLVDGQATHYPAIGAFKTEELFGNHLETPGGIGLNTLGWYINMDTWNKLPPKAQKAFMDVQDWVEQETLKTDSGLIEVGLAAALKMGHPIQQLAPEERERWMKLAVPIHEKWIAAQEAKGLPGRAVYNEAKRLIAESYKK